MSEITNIAERLERWILENEQRLAERFRVVRVNDWSKWQDQGIALDLEGDRVSGRVTAWASNLGTSNGPFADLEAIDTGTAEKLFYWAYEPLSETLLSKWLAALEAH